MTRAADIYTFTIADTVHRLRDSLRTLEWGMDLMPARLHRCIPDGSASGTWSAVMNLPHLVMHDERIALPVVESLVTGGDGLDVVKSFREDWLTSDAEALAAEPIAALRARLRAARARQVALAERFTEEQFNTPMTPGWGDRAGTPLKSPGWVLYKTFQHTWEHGDSILRIALFAPR